MSRRGITQQNAGCIPNASAFASGLPAGIGSMQNVCVSHQSNRDLSPPGRNSIGQARGRQQPFKGSSPPTTHAATAPTLLETVTVDVDRSICRALKTRIVNVVPSVGGGGGGTGGALVCTGGEMTERPTFSVSSCSRAGISAGQSLELSELSARCPRRSMDLRLARQTSCLPDHDFQRSMISQPPQSE